MPSPVATNLRGCLERPYSKGDEPLPSQMAYSLLCDVERRVAEITVAEVKAALLSDPGINVALTAALDTPVSRSKPSGRITILIEASVLCPRVELSVQCSVDRHGFLQVDYLTSHDLAWGDKLGRAASWEAWSEFAAWVIDNAGEPAAEIAREWMSAAEAAQ